MPTLRKKLIEVALPLEDINTASAREKSIRHGHPSTLHLWWARRPLAAARAEIRKSWARWCKESGEDPNKLPAFRDPFAGGGALPLEAQRLGLEAYARWGTGANNAPMSAVCLALRLPSGIISRADMAIVGCAYSHLSRRPFQGTLASWQAQHTGRPFDARTRTAP